MSIRALAPLLVLALVAVPTAAAHKTAYAGDGAIRIAWGFLNEPAVTMTKTGLDLILTDNATNAPIPGAEATLNASLVLGEQDHEFALAGQHGQPGRYTDVITLTRPGLYSLRLVGTINGTEVDVTIPAAHEVEAIEETYFPAFEATDAAALAQRIAELETKVAALEAEARTQSERPTTTTQDQNDAPGFGLLAALAAAGLVVALLRRRA